MLNNRPLRVLFHSEFGVTTGFGGVSENIMDRLHAIMTDLNRQKYEIFVMGLGVNNYPFAARPNKPYKVIPMYGNHGAAPYGQDYARDVVQRINPDIVITFGDIWMCNFWNDPNVIPVQLRKRFKLMAYIAIDGYPVPTKWIDPMTKFDKLITFTQFGVDAIREKAKLLGKKVNVSYIYHGVDAMAFHPLPKDQKIAHKAQRGLAGKTIIGLFSRNQPRKHHPEFVEFAAKFLKRVNNDPKYMFYFHCMEEDAGWDLPFIIEDVDKLHLTERIERDGFAGPGQELPEILYNLKGRFIFPGIKNPGAALPIPQLNAMYNLCDAHVMLTSGEGFGLTILESMSAGVPTFTNDYAAGGELMRISGGGEAIKADRYSYRGHDNGFYRPHTSYEDAVNKVLASIEDETKAKTYAKKGRAFALSMNWDRIVSEWDEEIVKLVQADPKASIVADAV